MDPIDLHAKIIYHPFDLSNYHWIPFAPGVFGTYPRTATGWEQKCLDTANAFLEHLFAVSGFMEFFIQNNCRVKKEHITEFLSQKNINLPFPETREYREPFGWYWCQIDEGRDAPGHIKDWNGWLYDKLAIPTITVSVRGKEYKPFNDSQSCFYSCEAEDAFAWKICEASAYNVPYLYSYIRNCDYNIECLYEGAFSISGDRVLTAVMEYFDQEILPTYNVIVEEDSPLAKAGAYKMHIVDLEEGNLRELVRKNKAGIKAVIAAADQKT